MEYDPQNDTPEKIVADAKRYREDAMQQLAAIGAGQNVPAMEGKTREEAVKGLMDNIQIFEQVMRLYGWKGDA